MRIYTKTGDGGQTGLFGGARVSKASLRVEAYGTVDELNATLGLVRAASPSPHTEAILAPIQVDLFTLGAELACVPGKEPSLKMQLLSRADYERLERAIDSSEEPLAQLKTFILPGGSECAARLHHARTVCRRAERALLVLGRAPAKIAELADPDATFDPSAAADPDLSPARGDLVIYLNRLSDLLFTLARYENHHAKIEDVPWAPRSHGTT